MILTKSTPLTKLTPFRSWESNSGTGPDQDREKGGPWIPESDYIFGVRIFGMSFLFVNTIKFNFLNQLESVPSACYSRMKSHFNLPIPNQ